MSKSLKEVMEYETFKEVVLSSLEKFVDEVDTTSDRYIYHLYVDFHYSGLSDMSIKDILEDFSNISDIEKVFIDSFYEYGEYSQLVSNVLCEIENVLDDFNKDEASEIIDEHLVVLPHIEDILTYVDVNLNILVDFGDANYDFSLNEYDTIFSEEAYENSSILNLIKMFGYDRDKFLRYLKDDSNSFKEEMTKEEMEFFEDLYHEILNTTTPTNALTFFVKTNLRDFLILQEEKLKSITIKKGSLAGLYDGWSGAGSLLQINIPRDITMNKENLIIEVDEFSDLYSVNSIYGINDLWSEAEFNL